jgi:hypothetical protein
VRRSRLFALLLVISAPPAFPSIISPAFFDASIATSSTCCRVSLSTDCVAILVPMERSNRENPTLFESLVDVTIKALPEDRHSRNEMTKV